MIALLFVFKLLHFFPIHLWEGVIHLLSYVIGLRSVISLTCTLVFQVDFTFILNYVLGESISNWQASLRIKTGIVIRRFLFTFKLMKYFTLFPTTHQILDRKSKIWINDLGKLWHVVRKPHFRISFSCFSWLPAFSTKCWENFRCFRVLLFGNFKWWFLSNSVF